jgi:hypothetical protein
MDDPIQLIQSFNLSLPNVARLLSSRGSCERCECHLYIEGKDGQCASLDCGHQPEEHTIKFSQIDVRALTYPVPPPEMTIVIHAHGCDVPSLLDPQHHGIWDRVSMLSAVPHGCLNVGMSIEFLYTLDKIYKNRMQTQRDNLIETGTALTELSVRDQGVFHKDMAVKSFLQIPKPYLYRIHRPVVDRFYSFERSPHDGPHVRSFGIYVLYSSGEYTEQEDVFYNYLVQSELSQHNNLLSDTLHPSLHKYATLLRDAQGLSLKNIHLNTIIHSLFYDSVTTKSRPWQKVRIIDLGCRVRCAGLDDPQKFLDAATITANETAQILTHQHAGKKNKNKRKGTRRKYRV